MKSTVLLALSLATAGSALPHKQQQKSINSTTPIGSEAFKLIQVTERPYWLINHMVDSPTKTDLSQCAANIAHFSTSHWSIGHRGGGPLQFPEHSLESNIAGARMGAGILECDVAFTSDRELVCRHSHCDLHTTTNIVTIPELNAKCQVPFTPANGSTPATAKCCTQDITLAEFKSLCAKMDGYNASATNPADYLLGTPRWRTDLFSVCGTPLTLKEHIAMVQAHGLKHTPELKTPDLGMPWGNFTQQEFAHKMLQTYRDAGVHPADVFPQSFHYPDIQFWLANATDFAAQLVYLDSNGETSATFPNAVKLLDQYAADGVPIVGPPLPYLVTAKDGKIVPSDYAIRAKELGLQIVTWSLERSGFLSDGSHGGYYYEYAADAINHEGDALELLHVLHKDIGVIGVFSDWTGTTTFYANCYGL
ncbi:hypothetical protein TD95_000159 [Thielaviopsis punctulata]|uniref:glycerophosphodiester phosphodiesterase n=1 Tax=Thielaviopsis punctulata TaxID=72032 RepID=A0A0F4Z8J3_9PEZI|nr:hypothetical protein TD95_000159 [Thielaviopsis punctulata]